MDEPRTSLSASIANVLADLNLPVFGSRITRRTMFAKSISGSTVIDDEPNGKAANEIQKLAEELKEFCK